MAHKVGEGMHSLSFFYHGLSSAQVKSHKLLHNDLSWLDGLASILKNKNKTKKIAHQDSSQYQHHTESQ